MSRFRPSTIVQAMVAVILVFGIVVATTLSVNNFRHKNAAKNKVACLDDEVGKVLKSNNDILAKEKAKLFESTSTQILTLKNYESSSVCTYLLAYYYMHKSDTANAKKYLDILTKIYNEKQINSVLKGPQVISLKDLQASVALLEKSDKNLLKNASIFTNGTQKPD